MKGAAESLSVLHVDDERSFGRLTARLLAHEDERLDVVTVTSVCAALDVFDAERVDCILSDYEMPLTDGLAFLEMVRERDGDVPFIMFTGQHDEGIADEAVGAGVTEYHIKTGRFEQYSVLARRIVEASSAYRDGRWTTCQRR